MIALSRLKRAIEDVPTGGMQTGDPKVRLKMCDAQRLEVEFSAVIAERDAVSAQSTHWHQQSLQLAAELASLAAFRDEVVGVMNNSQGVWGWHHNHTVATWDELFPVVPDFESPTQHLRDIQAEAGRAGYEIGFGDGWEASQDGAMISPDTYAQEAAEDYADCIRRGEK